MVVDFIMQHFSYEEALRWLGFIIIWELKVKLSHYHIEHHHQDETDGKADGAEVRVLALRGFWDEFFDDDIEHGTCSKSEHVREDGHQ